MNEIKTHSFLGISVNDATIQELNQKINEAITENRKEIISNHNLHSLYIYHKEKKMREFYSKSKYVHIDGMSLILLGRLFGAPLKRDHRVTYVDWIRPLIKEVEQKKWRIFFVGSKPGVGDKAASKLKSEFPELMILTEHGYFDINKDSKETSDLIRKIRDFQPHILMVGMGMPRQEYWVLENYECLSANIILQAGACMDYVAGVVPTAPRWIGRVGLEWLYRLCNEPKRLWSRYLLEPFFILKLIALELFKNR
jgi:N-acetylglucosaminyldiphosphoundecaprenol N-acetyl-beta-D-mannosaminyltransferase